MATMMKTRANTLPTSRNPAVSGPPVSAWAKTSPATYPATDVSSAVRSLRCLAPSSRRATHPNSRTHGSMDTATHGDDTRATMSTRRR